MTTLQAVFKFLLFVLLCAVIVPSQFLLLLFHKGSGAYFLPYLWQKGVCKIFSITVDIQGTPFVDGQTLYISNHISYLDIPVIGSILKASFVAKEDVASWPVFGFLATLQQTAFISRSREKVAQARHALDTMLRDGKSIIVFPEGTSTDGREVYPFKASLFALAYQDYLQDAYIQPFTIKMTNTDGRDIKTQDDRDLYSWHLKMDTPLADHLWRFAKSRGAVISVIFHAPIQAKDFSDRKTLAKACYNTVSNGLTQNA